MEIKNSHKIDFLDAESIKKLEYGALQHRRFSSIEFKILKVDNEDKIITVQTTQAKSLSENYADLQKLITLTKDLFSRYIPDYKIHVQAIPYSHPEVDELSTEDIRKYMDEKGLKIKDIEKLTGIDKTNLSAWLNDKRVMSQPVKAMFYFMIKSMENINAFSEITSEKLIKKKAANPAYQDILIACGEKGTKATGKITLMLSETKTMRNPVKKRSPGSLINGDVTWLWKGCHLLGDSSKVKGENYDIVLVEFIDDNPSITQRSLVISSGIGTKEAISKTDLKAGKDKHTVNKQQKSK